MLEHRFGGSVTEFIISGARAASAANYHLVVWPVGNDGSELAALVGQKLVDGSLGVEAMLRQLNGGPPMTPVLRAGVLAIGESTGPIHNKSGLQ
jgi:hypothetical protein